MIMNENDFPIKVSQIIKRGTFIMIEVSDSKSKAMMFDFTRTFIQLICQEEVLYDGDICPLVPPEELSEEFLKNDQDMRIRVNIVPDIIESTRREDYPTQVKITHQGKSETYPIDRETKQEAKDGTWTSKEALDLLNELKKSY